MDMSLLPPCRTALEMHIRRVNYQVFIWVHAHENYPDLSDIEESGWKLSGGQIEYDWVKGNLIVPEHLIDILCNQNVTEDNNQEEDNSAVDEGVGLTNMVDEVFENETDDDD